MNATRTATANMEAVSLGAAPAGTRVSIPEGVPDKRSEKGARNRTTESGGDGESLADEAPDSRARAESPFGRDMPAEPKRRPVRLGLGLSLAALAGSVSLIWWYSVGAWVKTDNAYVAAHVHMVSARVAGTVQQVFVEENQSVSAGTLLARLDPSDQEVKRDQASAQVAQSRAQIQKADAEIAQARAQVVREQARATRARQDLARAESLSEGASAAISRQELDQTKAEADAANAGLQAAQAALNSATALAAASQAQDQVARANLREAELQLSYTQLISPADGRIGKRNLETGNRIQPGQALWALVEPGVWVTANFKETQLGRMRPGQRARVQLDAFPGRVFWGRVESLSPASGAQFALLPPDNATGNFTKIVQRVPVKILLEDKTVAECAGRIVPGLSALVEVKVRE